MSLTTFRETIMAELERDLSIRFVGGIIDGPVADRDIGCVWVAAVAESNDDIFVQTIDLRIRVFKQWKQETTINYAPDHVAALEDLAERVQTSLRDIQTAVASVWMFRTTGVELDLQTMGVEAAVLGMQQNPFIV